MKRLSSLFLVSLLSGATTLGAYKLFIEGKYNRNSIVTTAPTTNFKNVGFNGEAVDFTSADRKCSTYRRTRKNVSIRTISNPIMEFSTAQEEVNSKSKLEQVRALLFLKTDTL